jgi:bacillithiol biosynthesis cysteine-adding enzyme BshC
LFRGPRSEVRCFHFRPSIQHVRTTGSHDLKAMSGACIRHSEIPASTPLFLDYLYEFERASRFYRHAPALSSVPSAIAEMQFDSGRREALVEALAEQNTDGGPAVEAHLAQLRDPKTVVVVTGQQVGLFGGPVFAIYKALTAARLAAHLTSQGISAVPVFWLATEDHDLAEVDHAWTFNASREPVRMRAETHGQPNQPVGGVALTSAALDELRGTLSALPFGDEVSEIADEAYAGASTFGSGFSALFRKMLGRYGLLHLNPMRPSIRRLAQPLLRNAIEQSPALIARLMERGHELESAGYHTQVHVAADTSLVFLIEDGKRIALRRSGDTYKGGGRSYSTPELLTRVVERPEDFSPNALLRPVMQDFLLPTAVYIGGPAELAYLAQAERVYSQLLGRMPVVVPRASFSIVDARARKLLDRYGLSLTDCFLGPEPVRKAIAERLVPAELQQAFSQAEAQLERSLGGVAARLDQFDPTLADALDRSRRKIRYQFQKIRSKAAHESLRRDSRAVEEAEYLSRVLFPHKTLQERVYCALPFLAAHGLDLVDRIYDAINPDCHDHQVLSV